MDEIIEMKGTHESEVSWQRRKKFLAVNQSKFPNERLTALSYCYTNVLLYGCKYSKKLMEELYEIACDVANYPWDQPVNKTSMTNKIFDESIVVSTVQNSVKKNGQRNIKKRKSSSMKDFLKAFKDLNLDDNTADSQDAPTNENTILDNSQNENIQASFDNSIYREYICPVIDLQNKSNVVYSKLVRKDSDHTNKTKKLDPKTVATNTVHRKLIYDTFMPDLNLTSQVSTSKSVKPKTTSITCNPDDIHVTNKLNFVGSDNLHITESNTNKKSHSQVETEYVGNANQIEMKDKQTSHCSIKLHPTISIAKKSKRREIQLGSGKTYDCCKSKAKQKYENRKACTKINQKSNEKPETKTAEESLIHLKTDKITRADEVETDHLLFCCALTLLILLYNLFPLYDQYLQYGRDYAPPCSLGNRRSGYRVQLPRGENTE